jgi:POT family proton-dependent oligopeptide transporter
MLAHGLTRGLPGPGFWDRCRDQYSAEAVEGAKAASRVAWVFALIPFFWALWDQNSTTWVIQGEKMVPYKFPTAVMANGLLGPVLRFMVGDTIGAEQMQSLNALVVMLLVPCFTYFLFPMTERVGLRVTTLRRIAVGLFLTAFSFVLIAWLEQRVAAGEKLSILTQTWAYTILTAGEVLVSTTGLEFAFREAPAKMRSTLMSFWLLTTALGNLMVAWLARLNVKSKTPEGTEILYYSGPQQFFLFAGLLAVVGLMFIFVAVGYRYRDPSQMAGLRSESPH